MSNNKGARTFVIDDQVEMVRVIAADRLKDAGFLMITLTRSLFFGNREGDR